MATVSGLLALLIMGVLRSEHCTARHGWGRAWLLDDRVLGIK